MTAAVAVKSEEAKGDGHPPLTVSAGGATHSGETRAEFHARRAKGIGGSDVAAILGLSRYRTPEQVWLEKTGQIAADDTVTPDKERGTVFEKIARERYMQRSGNTVTKANEKGAHPLYPWMLYNVDAVEIDNGEEVICEVKCPSLGMYSRIKREGLPEEWRIQMQHYLCCTECLKGRFIIFCADRMELVDFLVEADVELHAMLIEKEREFWTLVEEMTPPANIVAEIALNKIVIVGEVEKRNDEAFMQAMVMLREAKALEKTAKQVCEDAEERVVEVIGEDRRGIFEAEGIGRVHYKDRTRAGSFDAKALANACPLDRVAVLTKLAERVESDGMQRDWIIKEVENAIQGCDLDLAPFYKPSTSYTELRPFFGKES